jgi:hypothetical protein
MTPPRRKIAATYHVDRISWTPLMSGCSWPELGPMATAEFDPLPPVGQPTPVRH